MKRLPMMLQLALILFCVMIIPTIIMTLYSGTQILGYSEKAIADSSLASLESNQKLNESALNYIVQDTVRLASSNLFDGIRYYKSYEQLNADYSRVDRALSLLKELQRLIRSNDGVYSAYFYLNDADYVISSDEGIIQLNRYEKLDWTEQALNKKDGIAGVWKPRKMESGDTVFSYLLPLNRLSTSTKGFLVVNFKESQIEQYMNASNQDDSSYMLVDLASNQLISFNNKEMLFTDAAELPFIGGLLKQQKQQGYSFYEQDGERMLYTWQKSDSFNWLYVNQYSMSTLLSQTNAVQQGIIVFTIVIILVGTVLTVLIATWVSKPLRQLAGSIRARSNWAMSGKNELAFLDSAFHKMQEEEEKLNQLITEHEQDACSLAVHHLLRGDAIKNTKKELLQEMFPSSNYIVAIISIDHYSKYMSKTSPETRSYHRYAFISSYEEQFSQHIHAKSVYYGEGRVALVLNFDGAGKAQHSELTELFAYIQQQAIEWFGYTVTIGVSSITESENDIPDQLIQAMELIKQRMMKGNGNIIYWQEEEQHNQKYIYPLNSERRIVNFIDTGEFDSIVAELDSVRQQIEGAKSISHDNIVFIYNQLIGVTIKHLNEKNINTSAIFADKGNIYSIIATMDTLAELTVYLKHFYYEISKYVTTTGSEDNYLEKIIAYLDEHYSEDIVFEDMAKEIGISYSYMRKLVYEGTGKSLIDYMNHKRIQAAKQLLIRSTLNVAQIAAEVGYNNIQSFNRFFRKYEGITPSSYKYSKLNG